MPSSSTTFASKDRPYLAALLLLFVVVAVVNTIWIRRDQALMPYTDSYGYLSRTLGFIDDLREQPLSELGSALDDVSLVGRPPLYQFLTIPAVLLWGRSEDAALSVNVIFLAILVFSTYQIGRLWHGPAAGLLAALLVTCYPPIIHLSRMYLPHYALPAIGALSLWLLLSLLEQRSIPRAWALGLALAAGIWTHPYFAWTTALPAILVGISSIVSKRRSESTGRPGAGGRYAWIVDRLRDPFLVRGWLPAATIALGAAAVWYLDRGSASFSQMRELVERGQTHAGFAALEPSLAWYALTAPGAISNVLTVAAAAGVIAALIRRRLADWVLLAGLFCAYIVLGRAPVLAWIYFASALPIVAVLSAWAIADLRSKRWRRTVAATAAAAAVFCFGFVTWGESSWSHPVAVALGSPLTDGSTCAGTAATALCPTPADPRPWPWDTVRDLALGSSWCRQNPPCRVMLVDLARTAPHALNFFLTKERLHAELRVAHTIRQQPYNFKALLGDFLLYPPSRLSGRSNLYGSATWNFLLSPPPEFSATHETVAEIFLPVAQPEAAAILIQRSKPLMVREAEAAITAIELPERFKANGYLMLARQYSSRKNYAKSVRYYRKALRFLPRHVGAHLELAKVHVRSGARDSALAQLESARKLVPKSRRIRKALARVRRSAENSGR